MEWLTTLTLIAAQHAVDIHWNPSRLMEEFASYVLLVTFFVFVFASLGFGMGGRRPKTHWTRRRARAKRRLAGR